MLTCSRDLNRKINFPSLRSWVYSLVSRPLKQELQQKEQQWRGRCDELQVQVQQLEEDKKGLQSRLKGSHAQEGMFSDVEVKCKICVVKIWTVFSKLLPTSAFHCSTLHIVYSTHKFKSHPQNGDELFIKPEGIMFFISICESWVDILNWKCVAHIFGAFRMGLNPQQVLNNVKQTTVDIAKTIEHDLYRVAFKSTGSSRKTQSNLSK